MFHGIISTALIFALILSFQSALSIFSQTMIFSVRANPAIIMVFGLLLNDQTRVPNSIRDFRFADWNFSIYFSACFPKFSAISIRHRITDSCGYLRFLIWLGGFNLHNWFYLEVLLWRPFLHLSGFLWPGNC